MRRVQLVLFSLAMMIFAGGQLQAALITESVSTTDWNTGGIGNPLGNITLTLGGLPTNAASDLSITFKLRADLDQSDENVVITVDGFTFGAGAWLNNNLGDDTITGPANDDGGPFANQSAFIFTGLATIPQANLLPLLADGQLSALFSFSNTVDNLANANPATSLNGFESPEFAEFAISYRTSEEQPPNNGVPEPTSLAIFGLGALCMSAGAARRRRKEQQAAA